MVVEVTTNTPLAVRLADLVAAVTDQEHGRPPHVLVELADRGGVTRAAARSLRVRRRGSDGRLDLIVSGIDTLDGDQLLRQVWADLRDTAPSMRGLDPVTMARLELWVHEDEERRRG